MAKIVEAVKCMTNWRKGFLQSFDARLKIDDQVMVEAWVR